MPRPTVLVLLLFAAPAHAQSSPAELVKRLGSGSFAQRERAARELDQLGELALPALEQATRGSDVETLRRAAVLLRRVEERTLASALLKPTPTRFQFKDTPIRSALLAIEEQTALKLRWPDAEWTRRKITVDTGTLPFWQAWAAFCKQANVHEVTRHRTHNLLADEENTLHLGDGKNLGQAFDDVSLSLRTRFIPLNALLSKPGDSRFACEILAEPRLNLFKIGSVNLDSVNASNSTSPIDAPSDLSEPWLKKTHAKPSGAIQIVGIRAAKEAEKPRKIAGKFTARFVRKQTALKIDRVTDAVGKTFVGWGGVSVEVLAANLTEAGDLTLNLHAARLDGLRDADLGPATTRTRSGVVTLLGPADIALAQLDLHDAAGKPLVRSKATYAEKRDGYDLHLVYAVPANRDVSLTLSCQRIVAVPVTFSMQAE